MIEIKNHKFPTDVYYDPATHFWVKVEGKTARIGIDDIEQGSRGGFVVVQFNDVGSEVRRGESLGSVEAEKHVGALKAPVSGRIVRVNEALLQNPRLANEDPYGHGWFVEMELTNFDAEKADLISGEANIRAWLLAEAKKYEERGWIAES